MYVKIFGCGRAKTSPIIPRIVQHQTSSNVLHVWMKGMMTEVTREMMSPGAMLGSRSYHPDATPDSSLHISNNLVFIFI